MSIEAMKQARAALEDVITQIKYYEQASEAIVALNRAIEKAEEQAQKQKPLAWMCTETKVLYEHDTSLVDKYYGFKPTVPLYAHPPTSILDELMEAVKPLANLDLQAGQLEKYDDSLTVYQRDNSKITIGDIRKARLALEAAKEQGL